MIEINSKYLKIAAIIVAIILLLVASRTAYTYLYHKLPPQLVDITIKYQPGPPCRDDAPIYMKISNDSYREVVGASFVMSVKSEVQGDNIAQLSSSSYTTDTIIKAGDKHEGCWSYPKLYSHKIAPEKLIYKIKRQVINFSD